MKKIITFSFAIMLGLAIQAQDKAPKFTLEISTDSILMGNYFEVKFTLENASGNNFIAPEFEGFRIVGGPNYATSMSFVNGEMSQTISYSYNLEPIDIGNYWIQPASVETGGEILETIPIEVLVVPNPDGIRQHPKERERSRGFFDDFFESPSPRFQPAPAPESAPKKKEATKPKKKKRKTIRI